MRDRHRIPFGELIDELAGTYHPAPQRTANRSMEIRGFEPLTYGLQSRRSSQLSYIPQLCIDKKWDEEEADVRAGPSLAGQPNEASRSRRCRPPTKREVWSAPRLTARNAFSKKGGDPAALSSTATLLRLHPPY
jgi:hypothetical protein